jgi:hypothetical protein
LGLGDVFEFHVAFASSAVAAMLLGPPTWFAIRRCRCRNPWFAGALGAIAGAIVFGSSFYFGGATQWGLPWDTVDWVRGYIAFRAETDQWKGVHKGVFLVPLPPQPGVVSLRPAIEPSATAGVFLLELIALMAVPAVVGFRSAQRPFSESLRRWYARETLVLRAQEAENIQRALAQGTLAEWIGAGPAKAAVHEPHCKIMVWYCPRRQDEEPEANVYVTITGHRRLLSDLADGPYLLAPQEAGSLVAIVPGVAELAGPAVPQLMGEAAELHERTAARIWPVQGPHVGQANTWRNRVIGRGLAFGIALGPGVFFLFFVSYLGPRLPLGGLGPMGIAIAMVLYIVLPLLVLKWTWYAYEQAVHVRAAVRYYDRCLTHELVCRPDPLVAASDPEAVCTLLVLRRYWGSVTDDHMFEPALLRVCYQHRGILGEGDANRYWIPAEAILRCTIEAPRLVAGLNSLHATVLLVRLGSGTWELPFIPVTRIEGKTFWDQAMALRQRILLLRPPHLATEAPITPPPPPPFVVF